MLFDEETFEILFISSSETAVCICSLEKSNSKKLFTNSKYSTIFFFIILWSKISIFELSFFLFLFFHDSRNET